MTGRENELLASEQMRDRIADWLAEEAADRIDRGSSGQKARNLLLFLERRVRSLPGRLAQPGELDALTERPRRNER
ncbi:hypothetical protein [Novosphingobium sp. HII-3]|uniref:hypothetical protein n=1 Tax=Novosphingobium sp. HII-3 TaxID=2075565 RepID=UPI0011AECC9E|nr:hypothetical protein [Novosphingobium sp. HII-3]